MNATSNENEGLPSGSNIDSGNIEPHAERKKHMPANTSERLRPKRVAKSPDRALPMMQPISADDEVKPCMKSV